MKMYLLSEEQLNELLCFKNQLQEMCDFKEAANISVHQQYAETYANLFMNSVNLLDNAPPLPPPVDIPSDEQIEDGINGELSPFSKPFYFSQRIFGAKWMRDKILSKNVSKFTK